MFADPFTLSPTDRKLAWLWWIGALGGAFLIIFGVKAVLATFYGSVVPFWDEWDFEAAFLYKPYISGTLTLTEMFSSHNEHRVFMTRVLDLALFEIAGGWDPILLMFANAVLHAGIVVFLAHLVSQLVPVGQRLLVLFFFTLTFAIPMGWDNIIIGGDRSVPYFLLIFATLAIVAITGAHAFTLRWWLGLVAALGAYLSMASGIFALAAAFAITALQLLLKSRQGSREWMALGVLFVVGVLFFIGVKRIPQHDMYKATSVSQFLTALTTIAAMPLSTIAGVLIVQWPLGWLLWRTIRQPPPMQSRIWSVLGLAALVAASAISVAYGRHAGVEAPRYLDLLLLLVPLNFGALLMFCNAGPGSPRRTRWVTAIASSWAMLMIVALSVWMLSSTRPGLASRAVQSAMQEKSVPAFLATGDRAILRTAPPLGIPYPDPERLGNLLSDRGIRAILPAAIRPADVDVGAMLSRTVLKGAFAARVEWARGYVQRKVWLFPGYGIALLLGCALVQILMQRSDADPAPL